MPRKNKIKNRSRRRAEAFISMGTNSPASDRVRERGCCLFSVSISSTQNAVALPLSLDSFSTNNPRFATLMETYQFYRFRDIKLKLPPQNLTDGTVHSLAYIQGDPTAATTLLTSAALNSPCSIMISNTQTVPQVLHISSQFLIADGQSKWYRSQPSAAVEAWEENQGEFIAVMSTAATAQRFILGHMFYDLELACPVSPALLPREPALTDHFIEFLVKKIAEKQILKLTHIGDCKPIK